MGQLPTQTYHNIGRKKVDSDVLRQKLKLKQFEVKRNVFGKYPHVGKFFADRGIDPGKIREHSAKLIGTGAIVGSLLFLPPVSVKFLPSPPELLDKFKNKIDESEGSVSKKKILVETFNSILPVRPRPLTRDEEKLLEQIFGNIIGIPARATLEGEHLNTTYGFIGAEQHLRRYPGDSVSEHGEGIILKEGMARGLGAWGYFSQSRESLTEDLEDVERWYAVVQTLYLSDWNKRQPYLKNWYKYRKVLIVNTQNGNAVVASIADSGPAAWTGKHFGGSPEVMEYLGGSRYKKGAVIIFFVDDPKNRIPLGPVEYANLKLGSMLININK